jgi:hypothetical protein
MARYRVAFDGKWQGTFDELEDALDWAREVGKTGRLAYVIQRRWWWPKLVTAFPERERDTAHLYWKRRGGVGGYAG